jgi:CBS domain-containing protein
MKVNEVMTANPKACILTDSVADAARLMWEADCGIVPVVADGGKVVGLITDRDVCMAGMTKGRNQWNIPVEDVISGEVFACKPDDDIRGALETMRENKVRRLAVIADDGKLAGMLSINDVLLRAEESKKAELTYSEVVNTYKSIGQHRLPMQQAQATAAV